MVNSYRVSGGRYDAELRQYITDCCAYLNQFLTDAPSASAEKLLAGNRQTFMIDFEHEVNQLIRQYETAIAKA
ncbi:hypothetical protein HC026_02110 [Lactobacillus sp. LC28-10]|uniref:Uncharacterized protein n=1 Tax=Secundilactobacillus angelensis TaxID=2722706 RepID=A0ABX1KX63_9LACO|nr:hypothetical protein [Secundilactobacillus angelensis]MCH5461478.1 hypothetical protein [Secundilactobacillus angelensis]NLR17709.1 hypothetical protein [Secundilactobacillus angelensis]